MSTEDEGAFYADTTAILDDGCEIGADTKIWAHAHVCASAIIGKNCMLGEGVHIGPGVHVGEGCRVQNGAQLFEHVTVEENVFIGPCVVFTNVRTPRAFVKAASRFSPTVVKRGASIGANATVLPGVTIGEYALIGAGALISKDVVPYAIVVGNPAHWAGWVCECGEVLERERGVRDMTCRACAAVYQDTGTGTLKRVEDHPDGQSPT